MNHYPSIEGSNNAPHKPCYAFVKYDGASIRAEWSRKRGWYKFGTRKRLLDQTDEIFGPAIPLFLNKYGDSLPKVFLSEKDFRGVTSFIVFFEYFGEKSLGGGFVPGDRTDVVLFDANPHKKGILGPKEFLDIFGHLQVAEVVYQGNLNQEFIENVRTEKVDISSKYEIRSEVPEGVVCKGSSGHQLWMRKIKTNRYKEELQKRYQADWSKFWE